MLKKIRAYVEQYHMLSDGDTVVAGVSGGADSVCLLLVLLELQKHISFGLHVVHVNHGIREEAGQDAAFVEQLCKGLGVSFFLVERNVPEIARREGLSSEEAGRQVRYEAFGQALEQAAPGALAAGKGKIAVAHNANDRAETMLFHLFRGSGLTGLCGIRPVREQVIRPLLCVERQDIETFLEEKKVSYCIDKTNDEDTYTRNRIRHHILPYAQREITEGVVAHMGHTAEVLLETEDFVKRTADEAYDNCVTLLPGQKGDPALAVDIDRALEYPGLIRRYLILRALEACIPARKDVTAEHVRGVAALMEQPGNRQISLPEGVCARREYHRLMLEREARVQNKESAREAAASPEWDIDPRPACEVQLPGLGVLEFRVMSREEWELGHAAEGLGHAAQFKKNQYTKCFDYGKIKKSLKLRNRKTGDYLTINQALSRKSLQDYMINEKIPRRERDNIWLLADGQHILWVIGYRISQEYKVSEETKEILQVQLRGGH